MTGPTDPIASERRLAEVREFIDSERARDVAALPAPVLRRVRAELLRHAAWLLAIIEDDPGLLDVSLQPRLEPGIADDWPPVSTEEDADGLPAVAAALQAYDADPEHVRMTDLNRRILEDACQAGGVVLGSFDHFIVDFLAGVNVATCAVVAGWVRRAAAGAERPAP